MAKKGRRAYGSGGLCPVDGRDDKWAGTYRVNGRQVRKIFNGSYKVANEEFDRFKAVADARKPDVTWQVYWDVVVRPSFDGLEAKTVHGYEHIWSKYLQPHVSNWLVADTTWRMVQDLVDGYPTASVQEHNVALFRKMCRMAMRDGILSTNPTDGLRFKKAEKRKKQLWLASEIGDVLEAIRDEPFEPLVLMELGAGLRHEEACGMRWDCVIELDGMAVMKVMRARLSVNGKVEEKGTKNEHSERMAVMGEPFASRFLEIRRERGMCCDLRPDAASKMWRSFAEGRGIRYVTFGNMRSNYATLQGEAKTPSDIVSMAMGHSDGTTRGRHYQQSTALALMDAASSYSEYIESQTSGTNRAQFSGKMREFAVMYEKIGQTE